MVGVMGLLDARGGFVRGMRGAWGGRWRGWLRSLASSWLSISWEVRSADRARDWGSLLLLALGTVTGCQACQVAILAARDFGTQTRGADLCGKHDDEGEHRPRNKENSSPATALSIRPFL